MTGLADRFADRGDLVEALCGQKILGNNRTVAAALADAGEVVTFTPGEELMRQGGGGDECYFLLAGKVELRVKGELLPYGRGAGEVVGEFSAVNPKLVRTATVTAAAEVVAVRCSSSGLRAALREASDVWRRLAIELTHKVEQRNQLIAVTNDRPRIFMIAAENRIAIAEALRIPLLREYDVGLWSDEDLVPPGDYQLDALHENARNADFGIVLAHPDDLRGSRSGVSEEAWETIRFELGFLMSELTRHRTLVMVPDGGNGAPPQLFKGMQPMTYQLPVDDMPMSVALAKAVDAIREFVTARKVRSRLPLVD